MSLVNILQEQQVQRFYFELADHEEFLLDFQRK